jgi:hypothetical protein
LTYDQEWNMAGLQDIELLSVQAELWVPARVAQPRLMMTMEARHRGRLTALRSECYGPGPFDELDDVQLVLSDRLNIFFQDVKDSPTTHLL